MNCPDCKRELYPSPTRKGKLEHFCPETLMLTITDPKFPQKLDVETTTEFIYDLKDSKFGSDSKPPRRKKQIEAETDGKSK